MNTKTYTLVLTILCTIFVFSQESSFKIPDSLKDKGYDYLDKAHKKVIGDTTKSLLYLKTYLEKGKTDEDKIKMAKAYSYLSYYQEEDNRKLKYLDSSIAISKNENNKSFPALAYSFKGSFYYERWNYEKALNNYLQASKFAKDNNNEKLTFTTTHNIALLKYKIGKYDAALQMFKKGLVHEKQKRIMDTTGYLRSVFSIAYTYGKKKQLDSSLYYGRKGLLLAQRKESILYYKFILNEGINLYCKEDYVNAINSITRSLAFLKKLEDKSFLVDAYFYLGKSNEKLKKKDKASGYYKKIDSVFQSTKKYISNEVRGSYEWLINYYKKRKDMENQLLYVERLLEFDSILNTDYKILTDIIAEKYDNKELIAEKERLSNSKNDDYLGIIKILIAIVFIISGLFYYQYRKRKIYQKRFGILVRQENKKPKEPMLMDLNSKSGKDLEIADELVDEVLSKLKRFEENLGFLSPNIYRRNLAERFKTNEKYISDIVNAYMKKSITRYINDLRINHAIRRLQDDRRFVQYSIEAIAEEIGFNNEGTFRAAFKEKTGITPSYFINKLKRDYNIV